MQQKQRFSNLQFGTRSVLWERFFILFVVRKNDIAWESTSLMWDVARCQTQTDTKPIGICSEILSCLCTYTLPHMYVQLRLNFSSRALLKSCCVSCSKINCSQFCSSMDFCFREVLGRESLKEKLVIWADRYKTDTRPIWKWSLLCKSLQNRYRKKTSRGTVGPAAKSKVSRKCS